MSDGLEHVGSNLGSFAMHVAMVSGSCEEHGAADVLVRKGTAWHCPKCLEAEMNADTQAKWMATRSADLMLTASIPTKYIGQRFVAVTDEQRAVRRTAQLYRDFILKDQAWASLIMVGKTGTGKTLLACELAQ